MVDPSTSQKMRSVLAAALLIAMPSKTWADGLLPDSVLEEVVHKTIGTQWAVIEEKLALVDRRGKGTESLTLEDAQCARQMITILELPVIVPEVMATLQAQPIGIRQRWLPLGEFLRTEDGKKFLAMREEAVRLRLEAAKNMRLSIDAQRGASANEPDNGLGVTRSTLEGLQRSMVLAKGAWDIMASQRNAELIREGMADFDLNEVSSPLVMALESVIAPRVVEVKEKPGCERIDSLFTGKK